MKDKNMSLTIGITAFLFIFIISLIYILYCYSYYDGYQKEKYLEEFNGRNYDYVYERLSNKDKLKIEDFNKVIDLMYNKNTLESIYNTYYRDSKIYNNSTEFINEYFYGNRKISLDDIEYKQVGKSNLFKRSFSIDNNSTLIIDNKRLSCVDNRCLVEYMFMGLHEVNYISNGFTYYGLVNVTSNVRDININSLDNLVNVDFDLETGVGVFNERINS